jgi:hypothetical protein
VNRCAITLVLFLLLLCPHQAYAKRTAAPKVDSVVYEGVRFTAPNDNGRRAYVQAWDAQTGRKLWEVTVFRNFIKPWLEECVQWVFIKKMRIENGNLIVLAERDRVYSVGVKTRAVRRLKSAPSTSAHQ